MKVVIYARYSSSNQREESIEGQLRECHEFAIKNDMQVINEYCDRALSGKTDNRPAFQQLIKDSEKGQFEGVIMYTLDRFARNRYDSAVYKSKLKKNGVRIFYAKQPMPDTPEGIILESVLEGYAEYYSENLSRNVKRGMRENALKCLYTGGGVVPLGFKINANKEYEIDPIGAQVVREVFELYAEGMSATKIAKYCNTMGYKTARGRAFGRTSLHSIFYNEKYIGTYKYDDIEIEDGIPAIIDKDLFYKVQEKLRHNFPTRAKGKAKEDYLLTTKVFCGCCGAPLVGESGTSRQGVTYRYYKCAVRKKGGNCKKIPEPKKWLEDTIVNFIIEKVLTDENIDIVATKAMKIHEAEAAKDDYLNGLKNELKEVNKKLERLVDAITEGLKTAQTKDKLFALEDRKAELQTLIATEENNRPFKLTKDHIVYWLESFRDGDINDERFRIHLVDSLLNSIYIYDVNGNERKIVVNFNLSGQDSKIIFTSNTETKGAPRKRCNFKGYSVLHFFGNA